MCEFLSRKRLGGAARSREGGGVHSHPSMDCIMDVCRIYVDIMPGKNCRQFSLLTWNSFIVKFIHQVKEYVIVFFSPLRVSLF